MPKGVIIILFIYQMKRNKDIKTQWVKRQKAILKIDGSGIKKRIDYDKVYAPVASCSSMRILLTLVALNGCKPRKLITCRLYHRNR